MRSSLVPLPSKQFLRSKRTLVLFLVFFTAVLNLAAQSPITPEIPVHLPSITGAEDAQFDAPYIPTYRTSTDGRIAMSLNPRNRNNVKSIDFFLIKPEAMGHHVNDGPNGVIVADQSTRVSLPVTELCTVGDDRFVMHGCLIDQIGKPVDQPNPYQVGADGLDRYDLTVYFSAVLNGTPNGGATQYRLWRRDIRVIVENPKTAQATIQSITYLNAAPVGGPVMQGHSMWEPSVTADGKLFVARIGYYGHTWTDPNTGASMPETGQRFVDMVYAYAETPGDMDAWSNLIPLAKAPYDNRINGNNPENFGYGFASFPFLDTEGTPIPQDYDMQGTYPWLDPLGKVLAFTSVSAQLSVNGGSGVVSRYPNYSATGSGGQLNSVDQGSGKFRGRFIAGLWTRGKIVNLDGMINNTDWGLGVTNSDHRMVALYEPNTGVGNTGTGRVRVGSGRQKSGNNTGFPANSLLNLTFFDSLTNIFNYMDNMKTRKPADVVWRVSDGRKTAEVAFDDYMHNDAFIISNMTASATFNASRPWQNSSLSYNDGFVNGNNAFNAANIRIQNAATTFPDRWIIPTHGRPIGDMRVENVALGGYEGRGLWATGASGIYYDVVTQPRAPASSDWFVSTFVDCRFGNDTTERVLIAFPDSSRITLEGRDTIIFRDSASAEAHRINLASPLPEKGWAHLGFQVIVGGNEVEFYLNGMLNHTWSDENTDLFQMVGAQPISLGNVQDGSAVGFRGWLDNFKVFGARLNVEEIANHADATLIGFNDPALVPARVVELSQQSNAASFQVLNAELLLNGQANFTYYASWHDYSNAREAHMLNIPAEVTHLRHSFLNPGGQLFHNIPRPDTTSTPFCSTCHFNPDPSLTGTERDVAFAKIQGLSLRALAPIPNLNAEMDPRRQPSQPPARISGAIPPSLLVGVDNPPTGPRGNDFIWVDRYILPRFGNPQNQAPVVDPGQDRLVIFEADTNPKTFNLDGSVIDDGQVEAFTATWSQTSGPAATIANPNQLDSLVTITAEGVYTFQLLADDGELSESDSVTITVEFGEVITLEGISLPLSAIRRAVGEWIDLNPTFAPSSITSYPVAWSSSDPGVATVAPDGRFTAVAAGDATITVSADGGHFEASLELSVVAPPTSAVATVYLANRVGGVKARPASSADGAVMTYVATGVTDDMVKWIPESTTDNYFRLRNVDTGFYLSAPPADGPQLIQSSATTASTEWRQVAVSGNADYFFFENRQTTEHFRINMYNGGPAMIERPNTVTVNQCQWQHQETGETFGETIDDGSNPDLGDRVNFSMAQNGDIDFEWTSAPGSFYRIESTSDLTSENWMDQTGPIPASALNVRLRILKKLGEEKMFYRVITW